jgi:hypothetical protein
MNTESLYTAYKAIIQKEANTNTISDINQYIGKLGDIFHYGDNLNELATNFSKRYELSSKQINKLKRVDPSKKIIDAQDIDWYGYRINFLGRDYFPQTTNELLELIFSLFGILFNFYTNYDIIWNDNGENRIEENTLNWANAYVCETDEYGNLIYDSDGNTIPIKYAIYNTDIVDKGIKKGDFIIDEDGNLIKAKEGDAYSYLPSYKDENNNYHNNISTVGFNTDTRYLET